MRYDASLVMIYCTTSCLILILFPYPLGLEAPHPSDRRFARTLRSLYLVMS
jgi:hypothetical protein